MELLGLPPGPLVGRAWALKELRLDRGPLPHDEAVAELRSWAEQPRLVVSGPVGVEGDWWRAGTLVRAPDRRGGRRPPSPRTRRPRGRARSNDFPGIHPAVRTPRHSARGHERDVEQGVVEGGRPGPGSRPRPAPWTSAVHADLRSLGHDAEQERGRHQRPASCTATPPPARPRSAPPPRTARSPSPACRTGGPPAGVTAAAVSVPACGRGRRPGRARPARPGRPRGRLK